MDLTGTKKKEKALTKKIHYAEAVRTACLHLEHTDHRVRTPIAPYGIRKMMAIHIRIRETHLNHHPTEGMAFNERKPAFAEGLKNFFINTSSQKKAKEIRMHVRTITNAQMCGSNLSVSAEIHTTPETKHPITVSKLSKEYFKTWMIKTLRWKFS